MANTTDQQISPQTMLSGATATATGGWISAVGAGGQAFQAVVSGSGAVAATVVIDCSVDGVNAAGTAGLGTITLSGTTSAADGFGSAIPWAYYRARLTAISGTGAAVTVTASH